jgi:hypothetical protein
MIDQQITGPPPLAAQPMGAVAARYWRRLLPAGGGGNTAVGWAEEPVGERKRHCTYVKTPLLEWKWMESLDGKCEKENDVN